MSSDFLQDIVCACKVITPYSILAYAKKSVCLAPAFVAVMAVIIVETSLLLRLFWKFATIRMMIEQ